MEKGERTPHIGAVGRGYKWGMFRSEARKDFPRQTGRVEAAEPFPETAAERSRQGSDHFRDRPYPIDRVRPIAPWLGLTAVAFAQGSSGEVVTADSCTITGANTVAVQFGSDDIDEDVHRVQVRVTMPGNAPRTVADVTVAMKRSIRP